ncbi:MAG: hypothetical protein GF350_08275 [Chitinivibrionales bacterium]|nr:hypothetical protein [Chitinivibrionales bacterium]
MLIVLPCTISIAIDHPTIRRHLMRSAMAKGTIHSIMHAAGICLLIAFTGQSLAANSGRTQAILEETTTAPSSWSEWFANTGHRFAHNGVITEWRPGKFVCTWYYGVYEEGEEQDLYISYNHGSGWVEPIEVANHNDWNTEAIYNPVVWQPKRDPDAPVYLFTRPGTASNNGRVLSSSDGGKTWSNYKNLPQLPDGITLKDWGNTVTRFVGPNNNLPLEFPDGSAFYGSATEVGMGNMNGHIEVVPFGNYDGQNPSAGAWDLIQISGSAPSIIQPAFLVLSGDYSKLASTWRNDVGGPTYCAISNDGGRTWGGWTNISNDGQHRGQSAVTLDNGWHILCGEGSGRSNIKVSICPGDKAVNNRSNWDIVLTLQGGDLSGGAYPTIMQVSDRRVHIVYRSRWTKEPYRPPNWQSSITDEHRIAHVILDPDILVGKSGTGGPSISAQPITQSAGTGGKATFQVSASGSGSLYYQWQRNTGRGLWQDVGRGDSYTTENATSDMHGWQYRVVVTDDNGSTVSDAAPLAIGGATIVSKHAAGPAGEISISAQSAGIIAVRTGAKMHGTVSVKLFDMHGSLVDAASVAGDTAMLLRSAGAGMFVVKATVEGREISRMVRMQ